MASLTLRHCKPVVILGPLPFPLDVQLQLQTGGSPGQGMVEVSSAPGVPVGVVPCGSVMSFDLIAVPLVSLHYRNLRQGPIEIEVEYEIAAS